MRPMICPNCGEVVESKHSFCVVCGADLTEKRIQQTDSSEERVRGMFRKPIALRPNAQRVVQEHQQKLAKRQETPSADEAAILPDFI